MSLLTRPRGSIPLVRVVKNADGSQVGILEPEWDRYFSVLEQRAGGISGLSTTDVDAGYFVALQPLSQGGADAPELFQPGCVEAPFPDITQAGGECCLPEMTFQR